VDLGEIVRFGTPKDARYETFFVAWLGEVARLRTLKGFGFLSVKFVLSINIITD